MSKIKSTAERFQQEKNDVALLSRKKLKWHQAFPISIRQTIFPSFFQDRPD